MKHLAHFNEPLYPFRVAETGTAIHFRTWTARSDDIALQSTRKGTAPRPHPRPNEKFLVLLTRKGNNNRLT